MLAEHRVLLVEAPNGVPVDIALAALPFEAQTVQRASLFEFVPGCSLRTCSAEDRIVLKLFAFRAQDLVDVEFIGAKRGETLEWAYIMGNLGSLAAAKEEPATMAAAERLRDRYRNQRG